MLMDLLRGENWLGTHRADARLNALYLRHYSAKKNVRWRKPGNTNSVGPGSPMCLLTQNADAGFIWLQNTSKRYDNQEGICCVFFRNEGPYKSSELILEAERLGWSRWPGVRFFTYVNPNEVASQVPGWCFIRARWKQVYDTLPDGTRVPHTSKSGLLLFEKYPKGGRT